MDVSNANSSIFKTPARPLNPGSRSVRRVRTSHSRTTTPDRFIPSRAVNNFGVSQHLLSSGSARRRANDSPPTYALSPAKEESKKIYNESLSATFGIDLSNKVLNFGIKRFQSTNDLLFDNLSGGRSAKKTPASTKRKRFRTVSQTADRVLDAPDTVDDFYINTLDWGSSNSLAVALGNTLYIWKSDTGSITELYRTQFSEDYITSVQWDPDGHYLAIGTSDCDVQIWNVEKAKMVRSSQSHVSRVGCLSWNGSMLSSGSRSGEIHHHDVRAHDMHVTTLRGHNQEVCGLKWSPNGRYLASGSNDCVVNIWDSTSADPWSQPRHRLNEHKAAVKSLAWCPWQTGLLATGGGSADKNVHFWNATSGQCVNTINTDSQVRDTWHLHIYSQTSV
jgi:cell division cycle protein 20 (cofactor of APC complex)